MTESAPAPIAVAQNTDHARRLLAAQSRLYTDSKRIHDWRVTTVALLAALSVAFAMSVPDARQLVGLLGGVVTFLWSLLGSDREKRRRREAASVQEEFDTYVFELPANALAIERPSPTLIAEAAARYKGNRTRDWYPDTRPVTRPLDVLICQRSNLGWGSSSHRAYSACLIGALVALVIAGVAVAAAAQLTAVDALTAVVVPLLAPARELVELIRANRDSAEIKAKTESKLLSLWGRAMRDADGVTLGDCRSVQDRILQIRQTNAHVPDWLDNARRSHSETVMQESATHLIEDAVQHGRTT